MIVHIGSNSLQGISYVGKLQVVSGYILSNLWFVPGRPFQTSLMFVGKARSLPKARHLPAQTFEYAAMAFQWKTLQLLMNMEKLLS